MLCFGQAAANDVKASKSLNFHDAGTVNFGLDFEHDGVMPRSWKRVRRLTNFFPCSQRAMNGTSRWLGYRDNVGFL